MHLILFHFNFLPITSFRSHLIREDVVVSQIQMNGLLQIMYQPLLNTKTLIFWGMAIFKIDNCPEKFTTR